MRSIYSHKHTDKTLMLSCHLLSKFGSGASNNNMEHAKVRSGNALSMLKGISADQEERTAG